MPLYTGLCFFKELVHALFYWSPSCERSRESRHHSYLPNEKTGASRILLCKLFCPWKPPSVIVAVHTNLKYYNYANPRCALVSFFTCTWRRAGEGFSTAAFHSVSHRRAFLSGSWQEGEEHVTNFGAKVDFSYNVEVRRMGTVVSQKRWDAETHEAIQKHWTRSCLCSEGQRCLCPLSICSCLPEWSVSISTKAPSLAGIPCVCSESQGTGNLCVMPSMCLARLYQGFWRVLRPREWALRLDGRGFWKPLALPRARDSPFSAPVFSFVKQLSRSMAIGR